MSKKAKGKKSEKRKKIEIEKDPWHADLHPETKNSVFAILAFVAAVLLVLSFIGKGGNAGNMISRIFTFFLGSGYFFAPLTLVLAGFSFFSTERPKIVGSSVLGATLFLLSSLTLLDVVAGHNAGGVLGRILGTSLLMRLFDFWASMVIALSFLAISILVMFNLPLWRKFTDQDEDEDEEPATAAENTLLQNQAVPAVASSGMTGMLDQINATIQTALEKKSGDVPQNPLKEEQEIALRKVVKKFEYKKPPFELLQGDRGKASSGDIRANANIIKRTLENFGIVVDMDTVSIGPTVTQYTLKPAEGVKVSKITGLHNDLSLALAAHPIRIEAPIPGKSLVGIEVPNRSVATVGLRSLMEHQNFQGQTQPLLLALGRDVSGVPVFSDLAKMPHLLVSGSTGSGKSVCAHALITSLLYRNPPEMLRFILVDPKRVELSVYNDIPHLLTPVITDPKKTVQALRWATKEMDRRYSLLSQYHTRDITGFNAHVTKTGEEEILPYIVIMIDELADLMMLFPREVEASIIRLAQMARAVGIHLIVATQRPSVEVITGLIKANITARISFQVASQIDSRTILDMAGAEKLMGNGDMLFLAGDTAKPRRIQGGFVSEQEVKRVVDFLREQSEAPDYNEAMFAQNPAEENIGGGTSSDFEDEDNDPLYDEAKALVVDAGKASASYLQRRLRVGYARAARLLDLLEERGIIGPGEGAKPREVLMKGGSGDAGTEGMI
ncbi:MAG: DNA translocase FtsK 4TM domain-containing protein [Candidatus Sungbacteria bacterium]|nr:DNA translocase FtsK 4TM domain-containing protein [Candidatus Sungbacteria bacterium]